MKRIVLFGGSGGLGSQLSKLFEGEFDIICPTSKEVNLSDFNSVKTFFNNNQIDIVINLSGKNSDGFIHKISESNLENIDEVIDVNIKGNVHLLASCLPQMREKTYGRIILVSSILSEDVIKGTSIYSASKNFIDSLVRTASSENISKGITVNSLRLGYFDGGMCHRLPEDFQSYLKSKKIGLKRWGKIEELYNIIKFIIDTEYMTGQNLRIDGGL